MDVGISDVAIVFEIKSKLEFNGYCDKTVNI